MSITRIDKPKLNRSTPEENIALLDKWISDTADRLNMFMTQTNRQLSEKGDEE